MTNNIFYHMLCINDSLQRYENTYQKIIKSGLIKHIDNIFVNCVGKNKEYNSEQLKNYQKVTSTIGYHDKDESETLNILRDFAIKNNNGYTLYLHSKGVTAPKDNKRILHKDCMEYFLIEKFDQCFEILKSYDNCGVQFRSGKNWSCYTGNFWWSTNKYLKKLDKCKNDHRFQSESHFLKPLFSKYKCLYKPPESFLSAPIYRKLYIQNDPLVQNTEK